MKLPVPEQCCFPRPPHRFEAKQIECLRSLEMDDLGVISHRSGVRSSFCPTRVELFWAAGSQQTVPVEYRYLAKGEQIDSLP